MSASEQLADLVDDVALAEADRDAALAHVDELELRIAELEARPAPTQTGRYAITPDWRDRMPVTSLENPGNVTVVEDPSRGDVLEVVTPAGQAKGFGAFIPIAPRDEIRIREGVWFGPGYQWVNPVTKGGGGKLGGLALTKPSTAALRPMSTGGDRYNGSTRLLRKADLVKQSNASLRLLWEKDRRVKTYFYLPDPTRIGTTYGTEGTAEWSCFGWYSTLTGPSGSLRLRDGWNDIELYVKLNTVGQRNGLLEIRLNGELGIRLTDMVYRTSTDVRISHLFPTWYHGGGPNDYPTIDNRVRLDGFEVLG
jgi:hypothetical protein